jgi:hypothetical protein
VRLGLREDDDDVYDDDDGLCVVGYMLARFVCFNQLCQCSNSTMSRRLILVYAYVCFGTAINRKGVDSCGPLDSMIEPFELEF